MARTRDERLVAQAASLAASGTSRANIAAALGVSERTVSRWLGRAPGRPRATGPVHRTTEWRRRKEAGEGA